MRAIRRGPPARGLLIGNRHALCCKYRCSRSTSQMTLRRAIFWIHLCVGVTAAIVILMMSVTGVDPHLRNAAQRMGAAGLSRDAGRTGRAAARGRRPARACDECVSRDAHSIPEAGFRYVEERFASAFWGLEKLVAVLVKPNGKRSRPVCDSSSIAKKGEGPTTADRLQRLCDSLGVTWRDLYPANRKAKRPKFIDTRNKIFHSHRSVDGDLVWRETHRVSMLFERLVLKTLGWSNMDNTTPQATRVAIDEQV